MGLTPDHDIRIADPTQWPELSATLAEVFYDDPVFGWLLPDKTDRIAALRRFFVIETRHIALGHRYSTTTAAASGADGAALILPPGHWRTPLRVQAVHASGYLRIFRRRLPRALGVLTALERRHPRQPHYYLPYIGVRPHAQGQGLGTALLAPLLQRCDREALPVYLEATSPDNARLYRRLGFTTRETLRPLGSPPIELMIRNPPAAAPPHTQAPSRRR
jgi:GNAT superfamily N-acetyltransferase